MNKIFNWLVPVAVIALFGVGYALDHAADSRVAANTAATVPEPGKTWP